jgi:hypothetical protein
MAAGGALLFSAFNLIGAGISAKDKIFAAGISESSMPLTVSIGSGLIALVFAEIAAHKSTPKKGHPHSVQNYLQSAFVLISVQGLGWLVYGFVKLISAATVRI